jgi:hypothetical protein
MPIEFACSGCSKTLRVADDSAGKQARCPECRAINDVPFAATPASASEATPAQKDWLFSEAGAKGGSTPFGDSSNPYAAPNAAAYGEPNYLPTVSGPIVPTVASVEAVLNYSWEIWKQNLGILVGLYVVIIVASYATALPLGFAQIAIEQNNGQEAGAIFSIIGNIVSSAVQLYLQIGMGQIMLKLARRQPAEFTELFTGGPIFFPVLGVSILFGLAVGLGMLLLIVPGIILALMLWPTYWLVLDGKAGVIESFSLASTITKNNWGTGFLLALLQMAIGIVGMLALCIGIIFAAPLAMMLWPVAYLMMSGQLSTYPQQQQQLYPQQHPGYLKT